MAEILSKLLDFVITVFSVSSMLAVGLRYTIHQFIAPLRNPFGVIFSLGANFILVPLLGIAIAQILSLDRSLAIGLLLVATAAGAPLVIKLTQLANGDMAFSSGILVLLLLVTIGYMPFVAPWLAPGAVVDAGAVARPLVLTMLLPLGVAFLIKAFLPRRAERLQPIMSKVATITLAVLVALTFLLNLRTVLGMFGTGAILASALFIGGAFALGYLAGGVGEHKRDEMALCTAHRNYAAAMVVATQSFDDPNVLVMVVVLSVVSMALLFPAARALRGRAAGAAAPRRRPQTAA